MSNKNLRQEVQVDRNHYFRPGYLNEGRMATYAVQYREVMEFTPDTVLEIGVGPGILAYILEKSGIDLTIADIDPALEPDVIASVEDLPFDDGSFDVVTAFEVLEHIPFSRVYDALKEIHRVCSGNAIISVPDARPVTKIQVSELTRLPGIEEDTFLIPRPVWRRHKHEFNGEHYWEINKDGYPRKRIEDTLRNAGFDIEKSFRPWHMPKHRFFRLHKTACTAITGND